MPGGMSDVKEGGGCQRQASTEKGDKLMCSSAPDATSPETPVMDAAQPDVPPLEDTVVGSTVVASAVNHSCAQQAKLSSSPLQVGARCIVAAAPLILTSADAGDLSMKEVEDLIEALKAAPAENHNAPSNTVAALEEAFRAGRRIELRTLEAMLSKLNSLHLGRRAVEVMEVMLSAGLSSKRAIYFALAAASRQSLYLQTAPLLRTLSTSYGFPNTTTKKALDILRFENETKEATNLHRPRRGYVRFQSSVKLILTDHTRTRLWCHSRNPPDEVPDYDFVGGKLERTDAGLHAALRREIAEEMGDNLAATIALSLEEQMKLFPEGQARARVYPLNPWAKMHLIHIWTVALGAGELPNFVESGQPKKMSGFRS